MSADRLRQAAEELRHYANNATPGVWKLWGMSVMADQDGASNVDTAVAVAQTYHRDEHGKPRTWDAELIRLMQPRVALALADWLDARARTYDSPRDCDPEDCWDCHDDEAALTLADLLLGGA